MTADEVTEWGKVHMRLFPDYSTWWHSLSEDVRLGIKTEWRDILGSVSFSDCCAVSRAMLAGTIECVPGWERSLLAARVASAARDMVVERQRRAGSRIRDREAPRRREGSGPGAGELYRQCLALIDLGMSPHEAAQKVLAAVPVSTSSVKCGKCGDSGLVYVWSRRSMQRMAESALGDLLPEDRKTMMVPCSCPLGGTKCIADTATPPRGWDGWRESARYAPDRYCRCVAGDTDRPGAIEELREWVADYAPRGKVEKKIERVKEFDEWNKTQEEFAMEG
jgi:hypothetical protein